MKMKKLSSSLETLQSLLVESNYPLSDQFTRWKLWKNWQDYVGPSIAEHSEPGGYKKGKLYIHVHDSVWLQQLLFMKDHLKNHINQKLGFQYVEEVFFETRRRPVPAEAAEALREDLEKITRK